MGMRRNRGVCTKAGHKSAKDAWVEVRISGKENLRPYKCDECGRWHVSHSRSPFYDQKEIDRIIAADKAAKTLGGMRDWIRRQPVEVVMLMHDYCHELMTFKLNNVAPSERILRKRHKDAVNAIVSGNETSPLT